MYHYVFRNDVGPGGKKELKIDTRGFVKDMTELKFETIEKRDDFIHSRSTYPNGLIIEVKQTAKEIELFTSHPIILGENSELKFSI